ncbi:hypothetical protein EI94DRAFT_1701771 [Lactarius quietus]|nr:hypothetical protein EI94DRAFT_1701771 [Lactarius quietus]
MRDHWPSLALLSLLSAVLLANLATHPAPVWGDTLPRTTGRVYVSHLSQEQVAEFVAPHKTRSDLYTPGFNTIVFKPTGTNGTEAILRTISYALPEVLHKHVPMVAPTTLFVSQRTQAPLRMPRNRSSEEAEVIVNATATSDELQVRVLYKTKTYVPRAGSHYAIGILGLDNKYPNQADLMKEYRADALSATYNIVLVNGGKYNPTHPGAEASVDIQYCNVMAYPTPRYFYSTGGLLQWSALDGLPAQTVPYFVWFNYLPKLPRIPPTITISYANPESMFLPEYATTICELLSQLVVRVYANVS